MLGDTLAVTDSPYGGAPGVFVYERASGAWTLAAQFDGFANSGGGPIALTDEFLFVGDPRDTSSDVGLVQAFRKIAGNWQEDSILRASDAAPESQFGSAIAASGSVAVVGSRAHDAGTGNAATNAGSAYVFDVSMRQAVAIFGYDVMNANVSGTGGWAHEYTGTITPTTGTLANYRGGTGTMADGVLVDTTVLNTQYFDNVANEASITLYFDGSYKIDTIDIYGGDHGTMDNVLPGLLTSFDIEIGPTIQTIVTSGFGPVGSSSGQDWQINDRADLVSAGLSNIAVSSITLSNFRSDINDNVAFSVAEFVV